MAAVERQIEIQADQSVVWRLVATPEGFKRWFNESMEIEVRVGGKHRHFECEAGVFISGEVLAIEEGHSITLSWNEEGANWAAPTRVAFTLEPIPGGTRVLFRHDGFERVRSEGWERTYQAYEQGWTRHALPEKLKKVAEDRDAA